MYFIILLTILFGGTGRFIGKRVSVAQMDMITNHRFLSASDINIMYNLEYFTTFLGGIVGLLLGSVISLVY
jgi:hypothetical protein